MADDDQTTGLSRCEPVLMNDGSVLGQDRLDELVAQARAEAWQVLQRGAARRVDAPAGVSRYETIVDRTLDAAHLLTGDDLPDLVLEHAIDLGADDALMYLADLQQVVLVPFARAHPGSEVAPPALPVDSTLAGRVYQRLEVVSQALPAPAAGTRVWLPLLDGTERLGVLAITFWSLHVTDEQVRVGALGRRLRRLAALAAELVVTKTLTGDTIVRLRRQAPLGLAAELQWSQLPPLTFATPQVTIAGALEPAYSVAGDAVDYAVDRSRVRFAIFDGMGHGLQSAHLSVLAVAAYRNARRAGRGLLDTARAIDEAVHGFSPGVAYCSGVVGELDTTDGTVSWINAGHPEPLVLRSGRLATSLHVEPGVAFGLGLGPAGGLDVAVGTAKLQPGDRVVLYTDGVTEARRPDGTEFGLVRLVDLLSRADDPALPLPETMRRVVRALLAHQQDHLHDDATLLAIDWRDGAP